MPQASRRRWIVWGVALLTTVLVVAGVALGPMDATLRRRNDNVILLAWNDAERRLVLNERVRAPLQLDGPYVRRLDDGRLEVMRVIPRDGDWGPERRVLASPATIEVVVDNPRRTRFDVALRDSVTPAPAVVAQPSRLLLLSDLEGDFDAFVALLQAQGVIDARLHWSYRDGHVALAGDFVDRGQNVVPLLWLIYRLQDEAARAGGRVHYVLGNHELLALAGRFSDAPQRIFASRDAFFGGDNRRVFAADTVLGQWLRTQPVIAKIGDTLVVHGGVSEVFLDAGLDIEAANVIARRELGVERDRVSRVAEPVIGRWGVPWYRGMAVPEDRGRAIEDDASAHLDTVLRRYRVRRVAIGHTTASRVMLQQGGRLLRLNVDHLRQRPEGALWVDGQWWRVDARGGRGVLR